MTIKKKKETLLEEAIRQFNTASTGLEKSYRLLEGQVRQLKEELEVKNQALKESVLEQERLREQAERNDRLAAVGAMAARMAHELRNPLGSIELFVSLLSKGMADDSDKAIWIEHIKTGIDAMDYAISNLLLFTGKPKTNFKKIDLKKVIEESSRFAIHLLQQKEIEYVQFLDALTEPVTCDEDLLRQAFLNLILNAVDALPKKGKLRIEASKAAIDINRSQPEIVVKFFDNGCGIPKESLSKIFDPFYTTKNKGSGLGLAIVQNAIVAHHGVIEVTSTVGEGTCFTVYLPKEQP